MRRCIFAVWKYIPKLILHSLLAWQVNAHCEVGIHAGNESAHIPDYSYQCHPESLIIPRLSSTCIAGLGRLRAEKFFAARLSSYRPCKNAYISLHSNGRNIRQMPKIVLWEIPQHSHKTYFRSNPSFNLFKNYWTHPWYRPTGIRP